MFNEAFIQQIQSTHAPGVAAGEDLRYDDVFSQLKNMNASLTPDTAWMLSQCATLLAKSADWRLCMYAMNAAAISQQPQAITHAFECYAYIVSQKFDESYPKVPSQKLATLHWCSNSLIIEHFKTCQMGFTAENLSTIRASLDSIYTAIESHMDEIFKWHDVDNWLDKQIKARTVKTKIKDTVEKIAQAIAPSSDVESVQSALPFFDKFVLQLLKEKQYERAVSLARSHRWSDLQSIQHKDNKVAFTIRQITIDQIERQFNDSKWEDVVTRSEDLFLQPHAHFLIKLNYWSHTSLLKMGEKAAAEAVIINLKKLYKSYGQLFSLMYNGGQLFCDPQTLVWVKQHCNEAASMGGSQQDISCCEQWLAEKDVDKVKEWMHNNPIKTKADAFAHDYLKLRFHQSNDNDQKKETGPVCALYQRTIEHSLHEWHPELTMKIWSLYASVLKEDKQRNTNKLAWQSAWDNFSSTIAKASMSAALEIL